MEKRIAAVTSLVAFAMSLAVGAFEAQNPFATTVGRALVAMCWAYVVGYCVGWAAERMLADHQATLEKKAKPAEGIRRMADRDVKLVKSSPPTVRNRAVGRRRGVRTVGRHFAGIGQLRRISSHSGSARPGPQLDAIRRERKLDAHGRGRRRATGQVTQGSGGDA